MSSSQSNTNLYSSQEFWEVVEILKESAHRYFVRWAGLDPKTNKPWPDSWVAKEDCTRDLVLEWKEKKAKPRGRPSKESKNKTNRQSRSDSVKPSRYGTPESHSTTNSKTRSSNASPYVKVPGIPKRKAKAVDNSPSDTDDTNTRPKKRRKADKEKVDKEKPVPRSTTFKIGPPNRVEYIVIPDEELVAMTPELRKKTGTRETSDLRRSASFAGTSKTKRTNGDQADVPAPSHKKREKEPTRKPTTTRRSSSDLVRTKSRNRSGSANNDEVESRSSLDIPVVVEKSPSKNGFSQEIIQETTQQQSSSSQSLLRTSPKKPVLNGNGEQQNAPSKVLGRIARPTFNSRPLFGTSPIESFSPLQKLAQAYSKNKNKARSPPHQENDPIQDDQDQDQENSQVQFDDWLHEKFEEEETQPRAEEQPARSNSSTSSQALDPEPTTMVYRPRNPVSGGGAQVLSSIFGRLGKVFKAIEPSQGASDPIEEETVPSSHPQAAQASEVSVPENDHDELNADDDNNALGMVMRAPDEVGDEDVDEAQDIYKSFDDEIDQPEAAAEVHDPFGEEEVDQLGPDDAADEVDAIGSSVVESQPAQEIHSSLVVHPAQTQQTLQPVIESPVRQLDSALGLLHRKSEEIQQLRDRISQVQMELERARNEMTRLDQDLDRSEELREAQALRISQLEAELIEAKSQAAVNVVQNALGQQQQQPNPQSQLQPPSPSSSPPSQPQPQPQSQPQPQPPSQPQPDAQLQPQPQSQQQLSSPPQPTPQPKPHPDISDPSVVPTELISTPTSEWLEHLHQEIATLEQKVAEKERENNVFRTLYAQASSSHADNLQELRHVQRDNASLREQATTGVRQANVYWKTQIDTLMKKLEKSEAKAELLVQQIRATQEIRDKAALLPVAQKRTEDVLREVEVWKDRFAQMGIENTKLRFELKERDDAELARRREEREAEEETRRLVERENDQLLWICQWRDEVRNEKCGAILGSRDDLHDHMYRAGHVV